MNISKEWLDFIAYSNALENLDVDMWTFLGDEKSDQLEALINKVHPYESKEQSESFVDNVKEQMKIEFKSIVDTLLEKK